MREKKSLYRLKYTQPASVALLLLFGLASALPLAAGSTGTTALHTPQGAGAGTANGDYVTASGGMDTIYRWFIEVPSGLSRLVVELFDADWGAGGATEDTAQRDRDRGGYNSSVTYSLIDPSGTARTVRFATGSTTLPAGADNAWLALYNGTGNNVQDNFGTAAYTNNDGNNNWSAAWTESDGGGGGATGGAIQIIGGQLRLQDDVAGTPSIVREADLSGSPGLNLVAAYLSFDFSTSGNLEDSDLISVQVSTGGGFTTLETFSNDSSGSRTYDITSFISNTTQVRFLLGGGYTGTEFFFVDNLQIHDGGALTAGHWELRVDSSDAVTSGNDINALGIRAHDGTSGSGGTEINVYYDSHTQLGVNPPSTGSTSRSFTLHPYITSGCTALENDHDYDSNNGTVGSVAVTPRGGGTTQTFASAALSTDDTWNRDTITRWGTDTSSTGYGAWTAAVSISNYTVGGTVNGNYANLYFGNFNAAANPPGANPTANTFRVYLPTDAGGVPAKPYLEQLATFTGCGGGNNGPNPPNTGQTSCFTVTVRVVNPAAQAITFSASNLVTSNVPGSGAVYGGGAQVSQGSIVSQPSVGGTGNITWNPGTLAAGGTALLSYLVNVTPTSNGQRIPLTATPASGNGTRAQFVDETGNTTQTRATYLLGPVCELAVTEDVLTEAVVSSFTLRESAGRGVEIAWTTASEVGTAGFYVERWDARTKRFERVHRDLLAGLLHETQGGAYRFADESASPYEAQVYRLVEVTADGRTKLHGPYARRVEIGGRPSAMEGEYERAAHPGRKSAPAGLLAKGLLTAKAKPAPHGVHLSVEETGLYYLSAAQIAGWLEIEEKQVEKKIADGKVVLSQGGQPVAYRPDFAADKPEKRALGLFFYGEALDSLYSKANVYRLEKDKGGLLMSVLTVPAASGAAGGTYGAALHLEQDAFPATAIAPDPESDYWFWEFVQGGDPTFGVRSFALDAPGVDAAGNADLTVSLFGATASGVGGEHHVQVRLNGTLLGETSWEGIAPQQATFAVPPGLLAESGNQVEITGLVGVGAPFSIVYVASFDLSYVRAYRALGDRLAFTVPGGSPVGVDGFASPAVFLLDVATPRRPRWIEGGLVEPDGNGGNRLGFAPASPLTLFAAGGAALDAPDAVRPWTEAASRSVRSGGEYLVIAPPALRDAADRLAAYRAAAGGLSTAVVDTDQIFDELAFGLPTPHALRSFVAGALAGWRTKPRYLVLAGEGTLDYRNLLGFGDSVLPPLMVQATQGLFPSDNRLGDANGDGMPELAVGRIPVLTAAELDAYTAKIAAYEATGRPAWAGQSLLLADTDDGAASFAADSDELGASFDPSIALDTIYLPTVPLASARSQLFAAVADGRAFINYLGHGGLDRLSGGGLLTSADVPSLANGERLPVLTAMTCTVNRFAVPGVPALGELLVKAAGGGAAAVWGPTGLSDNAEARRLAERFYRQTAAPETLLGDRILSSLRQFRDLGGDTSLVNIYNLLGDPGLRLRSGPEPVLSGGSPGE